MDFWKLLLEFILLIGLATLLGVVFERLRQSAVVGYLISGVLLGPAVLGLVDSVELVRQLAELGVALLLFTIGLEVSFSRLRQFGKIAIGGGGLQILVTLMVALLVARALGISFVESLIIGAAISLSSTAVVLRVLTDKTALDSVHGRNSLGILLMQDLAVVPLVLLVSGLGRGGGAWETAYEFGIRILLAAGFVLVLYFVSLYIVPRILEMASAYRTRDLPVLLAVTVSLGSAWAAHALGLSPILGAFVGGILLAECQFAEQIRADLTPLQSVFVTLFFASIGMLTPLSPTYLIPALVVVPAILVVKTLIIAVLIRLFRGSLSSALATGLALSQIGEFSFVIVDLSLRLNILDIDIARILIASAVFTLFLTPYLISWAPRLDSWFYNKFGTRRDREGSEDHPEQVQRVVIIGYGPAGKSVADTLQTKEIPFLVLEINPNTVGSQRTSIPIEYGDATRQTILSHARIGEALAVVIALPDPRTALLVTNQVRALSETVPIIARSRYHIHASELAGAGADVVVDEEWRVGEHLLEGLMNTIRNRGLSR